MGRTFNELPLKTQMWIAPELRKYYDQISYETASDWLVYYSYGAVALWSSFEFHRLPENDQEFEIHKLALFKDAYSLYKIKSIKDIEYVTESQDESYRYLNYHINRDIRLNSDEVCVEINKILNEKFEVHLEKEDFLMTSRYVHMINDVAPFHFLERYNQNLHSVQKVIVRVKCSKNMDLYRMEEIKKMIQGKFYKDTTVIVGISVVNKEIKTEVDIFIYTNEEYPTIENEV